MERAVVKENDGSKQLKSRRLSKWAYFVLNFCAICFFAILYVVSVHRVHTISDVQTIRNVMNLQMHDHRCRKYNGTHYICLPNVFLIGASKCGTTSLMDYLVQHPKIDYVRRRIHKTDNHREIHRFDRNTFAWASRTIEQMDEWASSPIISDTNMAIIHYTPHYLYAPSVPYELKAFYPRSEELKFIVVLRDPVERALSSYWFQNSHLFHENDQGSIHEFEKLADLEISHRKGYEACMDSKKTQRQFNMDNLKTVNISISQGNSAYRSFNVEKKGQFNEAVVIRTVKNGTELFFKSPESHFQSLKQCFGSHFRSKLLGSRHIDKGIYVDQIQRWYENFPSHNFYFISLHEFEKNPKLEYKKLLKFVFSDDSSRFLSKEDSNITPPKIDLDSPLSSDITNLLLNHKRLVKPNARDGLQSISPSFRNRLQSFYHSYNKNLEKILEKNFDFN